MEIQAGEDTKKVYGADNICTFAMCTIKWDTYIDETVINYRDETRSRLYIPIVRNV